MENKHTEKCGFELNHQGKCVFLPQEPIPCCFSEVNELGNHITNCINLPTKLDKDNVQVRYFCEEHMKIVENIRRKMAQKYINEYKQKIIIWLNKQIKTCLCDELKEAGKLTAYYKVIEFIENGDFDNE